MRLNKVVKTSSGIYKVSSIKVGIGTFGKEVRHWVSVDLRLLGSHTHQYTFRRLKDIYVPYDTPDEKILVDKFVEDLLAVKLDAQGREPSP